MPGRTKEYENDQVRSPIIRHPYRINDTMILKMIIVLQRSTTSSRIWWKIFWSKRCEQQEVAFKAIISEALVISSRIDFVYNQSSILLIGRACSPPYKGRETRISSWKGNSEAKLHLSLRARTVGITNLERDHCGSWRRYGFIRLRKPVPTYLDSVEVLNHLWSTETPLVIKLFILRISLTNACGLIWGVCLGWLNIHY